MSSKTIMSFFLVLFLSACSSLKTVEHDFQKVKVGNRVVLTTKAGEEYQFKVETISATRISGGGHSFLFSDVSEIKVKKLDGVRTTLLALTVIVVLLAEAFSDFAPIGGD